MRGCRTSPDTLSAATPPPTPTGDSQHLQQQGKYTNMIYKYKQIYYENIYKYMPCSIIRRYIVCRPHHLYQQGTIKNKENIEIIFPNITKYTKKSNIRKYTKISNIRQQHFNSDTLPSFIPFVDYVAFQHLGRNPSVAG